MSENRNHDARLSTLCSRLAVLASAACVLAGCSKVLGTAEHDLSQKNFVSEISARVLPDWLNYRTGKYEITMEVPMFIGECPIPTEQCKMPGPVHFQLLNTGNQLMLVDKVIDAPVVMGFGRVGRQEYVLAQLFVITLPPGNYKASLKNLSDNESFKGRRALVRFQHKSKF